jgi:hypothetical protein
MKSEYPQTWVDGKKWLGHRAMWTLIKGAIPERMHVLHRCDVTYCVNPAHLFLGTHADNMADMMRKGRWKREWKIGEGSSRAKLTDDNVREIRRLRAQGVTIREVAKRFGVTTGPIDQIMSGKRWSHVK